ncbi:hypothetical protein COU61_00280 [Candidatus Pacearchaeota archaeon CG10_big_fil_rev_8_21_14_0_10_35_13]|nr:MAG: hypothetical protein COU61_00280 [Candidatus Pacearchaeota archaeon CG10_big_fil_rev_8_21_14_0_10_35_13]
MNKIDKDWYAVLKVLSKIPRDKLDKYKVKNTKKYDKYYQGITWNELHKLGYINTHSDNNEIVTEKGIGMLRMLEDILRKDLTLISSVIAVMISLVALAKSMGWI